jgi:hypothetical protein
MEQEANIEFCFKLGETATETVELMRQVYGDNCLSRAQIFRWYARFKSGVETIENEARPGCPLSVRNEGLIAKVYLAEFSLELKMFQTKIEEIKTNILYSIIFFGTWCLLRDNVENYGRDRQATDDSIGRRKCVVC